MAVAKIIVINAKPGNTSYTFRIKTQDISMVIENNIPCGGTCMASVDENHAETLIQKGESIFKCIGKAEKEV